MVYEISRLLMLFPVDAIQPLRAELFVFIFGVRDTFRAREQRQDLE